jgi:sugar lactone lactonase YvrE
MASPVDQPKQRAGATFQSSARNIGEETVNERLVDVGGPAALSAMIRTTEKHMKTLIKLACPAFTVVLLSIGAATANGAPNDLFVSVGNTAGSIYEYTPTGVQSVFASGLDRARGVAFDHASNLFVGNTIRDVPNQTWHPQVIKITPGGVQSLFATIPDDFFIVDVAFDGSGNLFVVAADETVAELPATIYKITPGGVVSTFGSTPGLSYGLAFDTSGNLFVADALDQTVYKFTPNGTRTVFVGPSAFTPDSGPAGWAFDRFGNLFVSTNSGCPPAEPDSILKFTSDGVGSTFVTDLVLPRGLAFDRSGNLFVAEFCANDILKFTPNGARSVFAGVSEPQFLTFQLLSTPRPRPTPHPRPAAQP